MGYQKQVGQQVQHRHRQHHHKAHANLSLGCNAPGQAPAEPGPGHDARDGEHKEPEELRGRKCQVRAQKCWCCQHVQEHAIERHPAGQRQQQKAWAGAKLPIPLHQMPDMEGLAVVCMQCFGQQPCIGHPQQHAHTGQEPEDAVPARMHVKPPPHNGCHGWRHAKVDGHLAHDLLRL